jgi:hypothetical protein
VDASDNADKSSTIGAGIQSLLAERPDAPPVVGKLGAGLKTSAKIAATVNTAARLTDAKAKDGDVGVARESAQIVAEKTAEGVGMVGTDLYILLRGGIEVGEAPLAASYTGGTMAGDWFTQNTTVGRRVRAGIDDYEYAAAERTAVFGADMTDPLHLLRRDRGSGDASFEAEMRAEARNTLRLEERIARQLPSGTPNPIASGAVLRLPNSTQGPTSGDIYSRFDAANTAYTAMSVRPAPMRVQLPVAGPSAPAAPPMLWSSNAPMHTYVSSPITIVDSTADSSSDAADDDDDDDADAALASRRAAFWATHRQGTHITFGNPSGNVTASYDPDPLSSSVGFSAGLSGFRSLTSSACDFSGINLRGFSLPDLQRRLDQRAAECRASQPVAAGPSGVSTPSSFYSTAGFAPLSTSSSGSTAK